MADLSPFGVSLSFGFGCVWNEMIKRIAVVKNVEQ
jgi:hypothetical protein